MTGSRTTTQEMFAELSASERGLSGAEAVKRLKEYGENTLPEKKTDSLFVIFARQFWSPFVLILAIAASVLVFLQEYPDAVVIAAILLVNAVIGVVQEGKAQNTLSALKTFARTEALVLRDGKEIKVNADHVVPGDILVLRQGNKVAADGTILSAQYLRVDESAMTGESKPVTKSVHDAEDDTDTEGVVLKGTYVTSGSAHVLVTATGVHTKIGSISQSLESIDAEVPLKKNIRQLSRIIAVTTIVASVFLFGFGIFVGYSAAEMFFLSVAIVVSVVPEGLPVVITLVLALGVHRMGKRHALVKRMQAVEALGQADVIAVDKTGTITKNELAITDVCTMDAAFTITGSGYDPAGDIRNADGQPVSVQEVAGLQEAARIAVLNADASVYEKEESGVWEVIGDPTEAALQIFGGKAGEQKEALQSSYELLSDIPFNPADKYRATLYAKGDENIMYVTGAPEVLMERATHVFADGQDRQISEEDKKQIAEYIEQFSVQGKRVLALARATGKGQSMGKEDVAGLSFVGLVAMQDTLREDIAHSITLAKRSGVDVVMITGDYEETAVAIARSAGIFADGDEALSGAELRNLSEEALAEKIGSVRVFARVTPEQKLLIIKAYQKAGKKIAMTGDGVNDALSLVSADLGIGMGKSGTEVAKEASDIVLLDDDMKSIVAAIEEGRNIYATIRRVIVYLFSTNLSELFVIVLALSLLLPLPLQPSQILWLNLITDGFLVLAFVFDKKPSGAEAYRSHKGTFIISRAMLLRMAFMATIMTVGTVGVFYTFVDQGVLKAGTLAMTTLALFQWFNIWNARSETQSAFSFSLFSNPYLVGSAALVIVLQLAAVYTPFLQTFLKTVPLSATEFGIAILVASSVLIGEEIRKVAHSRILTWKQQS